MNELIPIRYDNDVPTVSGRELHAALEIETRYNDWFPRMCEYGFIENEDFNLLIFEKVQIEGKREVTRSHIDHVLTIPMAKEISMLQRNEKGRTIRKYLIAVEDAWNTPEMVMSRALRLADEQIKALRANNTKLLTDNAVMQPKADYFDALVDRNLLLNFRETAKELKVKEREFVRFLMERKYIYRDQKGRLMPDAEKTDELFEVKECVNEKTNWCGAQTLITPKGRETFRLLTTGPKGA
jgi:anti-repressor protein